MTEDRATPRVYHHLGRLQLRDWCHVEIETRNDSNYVTFVSRWHVDKRFPTSWCYSTLFTDAEILSDSKLASKCLAMFGPDVFVGSIHI